LCSFTGYFQCLYRPTGITSSFFVDVHDLLENVDSILPEFFILGDFNLHLDTQSTAISTFNDILATFDLKQDFSFSTHIHGHWLDLITRCKTIWVEKVFSLETFGELCEYVVTCFNVLVNPHVYPEVNQSRWNCDSDTKTIAQGLKSSLHNSRDGTTKQIS